MAIVKKSQFSLGSVDYTHKGKIIPSNVGSPVFDTFISNIEDTLELTVGHIPAGFEHRPDLISNLFYGNASYWWLIMLVNNIADPFEGLNVGDRILLPKN